jgi:MFS family permease
MLTSPIFAEMYNFAILNVGIAAGICMIAISLIIYEKIESKKLPRKTKIAIIAICILVTSFAFGIYQAIVPLYLFIVAACYLLKCIKEKNSSYKWLIRQIIFFCSSALIYLIICKLFCPPNSYLNSGWSTRGLQCFKDILYVINETINCDRIYYNISYHIN